MVAAAVYAQVLVAVVVCTCLPRYVAVFPNEHVYFMSRIRRRRLSRGNPEIGDSKFQRDQKTFQTQGQ